ncbi:hypothetical protein EDB92DRAFT_1815921 [Lactarius akahatsu]|uniref:F-box domain-containing protein n=1 Tax=Lactarius akahatsu TaxID=416441 RepID=A0AAD4LHU1_9AGAM|nr:hypothetical protein EDB92DRAFT_1815921 [Lactarius akahatsu]
MSEPRSVVKSPVLIDGSVELERAHEPSYTIEVVPEEVILEIFHFHKLAYEGGLCGTGLRVDGKGDGTSLLTCADDGSTIMFASQHRLGLQLLCTSKTSIKQTLDIWPDFPILIRDDTYSLDNCDNIIDALQQRDRVCEIDLTGPFPLLDRLALSVWDSEGPGTFLSGPAPRLRVLKLDFRPRGSTIFSTKCISPEALVAALSAMTRLKTLYVQFLYPTPHSIPVNIPPSLGCIVSSTLLRLDFRGPCNYLEDLSRITTPSLECTRIKLDSELPETHVDIFQLSQFLYRVESQRLPDGAKRATLSIPMLSPWYDGGQGTYWVDFLRVFNRLEKLHLSGGDPSSVVHALQFVSTGMATDVLPVLRELGLDSVVYGPRSRKVVNSFLDVHQRARLPAITFRCTSRSIQRLQVLRRPEHIESLLPEACISHLTTLTIPSPPASSVIDLRVHPECLRLGAGSRKLRSDQLFSLSPQSQYSMTEPQATVTVNSPVLTDREVRLEHAHEPSYNFSTIEVVPDDVILEIFHFYKSAYKSGSREWQGRWHGLAHVCRRWRTIIFDFASRDRLNLRLLCTPRTSVKQTLDLWPGFPILVRNGTYFLDNWDNIVAALQQRDRVCEIDLRGPLSKEVSQILQESFPLLDCLSLDAWNSRVLTCPSTFLGGSAPRLRVLRLDVFQCLEFKLPPILSFADHLVDLRLERVESTKCIPPEALVAALSAMTRLKTLFLQFLHETSHSNPINISPLSSGRIASSALLRLSFEGPCNYLEDLLSRITAPSLECTRLQIFRPSEPRLDISQLSQFLCLVGSQTLPDGVDMGHRTLSFYHSHSESVALPGGQPKGSEWLRFELPFHRPHWQAGLELSLMTQFCQQISPFLSNVRTISLPILRGYIAWHDDRHGTPWMDFLRAFNRVERLHLSGGSSHTIVNALRLVSSGMATGVLPALHELNLDSVVNVNESQKAVTSFLDAHNHAGSPAITFRWLDGGLY